MRTTTTITPAQLNHITGGYDWRRTDDAITTTAQRWGENGAHYGSYLGPLGRAVGWAGGARLGVSWGFYKDAYRQLTNQPQQS